MQKNERGENASWGTKESHTENIEPITKVKIGKSGNSQQVFCDTETMILYKGMLGNGTRTKNAGINARKQNRFKNKGTIAI